jgi:hypothetical protein
MRAVGCPVAIEMTGRFVMQTGQNRRRMLATLSSAAAVSLIASETGSAQEAPPELTTIRLTKRPGICIAPQYVAEGLLKIGDVRYIEVPLDLDHRAVGTDRQSRSWVECTLDASSCLALSA